MTTTEINRVLTTTNNFYVDYFSLDTIFYAEILAYFPYNKIITLCIYLLSHINGFYCKENKNAYTHLYYTNLYNMRIHSQHPIFTIIVAWPVVIPSKLNFFHDFKYINTRKLYQLLCAHTTKWYRLFSRIRNWNSQTFVEIENSQENSCKRDKGKMYGTIKSIVRGR